MANLVTSAATPPTTPKTTTGKTLWILCVLLLIATVVVGSTSWLVFQKVYGTVDTVRDTTAPAILDVIAARDALVQADSAAIDSFQSGEVTLSGPGLEYQNQLTSASQHLVQAAERSAAGNSSATSSGSQPIQLLEALLESYSSLIGQADAHTGTPLLGTTDLWSASHLLHAGDSPILTEFNNLMDDQTSALNDQVAASSMTTESLLQWVVPIVLIFALLVVTQVFLRRRFRRAINPWLLLATAALIGLSIVTSLAIASQHQLENSRDTLNEVVRLSRDQPSSADVRGQQELGELMEKECAGANGGCGPTVNKFVAEHKSTDNTTPEISDGRITTLNKGFDNSIMNAGENVNWKYFIPILTGLIFFVFIPFGLWPRIEEYRYRPR
ncbi:MAG: hypothetical protein ABIZ05_09895 [Pseudonocardiaceae bacterium]